MNIFKPLEKVKTGQMMLMNFDEIKAKWMPTNIAKLNSVMIVGNLSKSQLSKMQVYINGVQVYIQNENSTSKFSKISFMTISDFIFNY